MPVLLRSRRQFLLGASGFTLALPFLPSLFAKAHAAYSPGPRLVMMATQHGGASQANMFPVANEPFALFPDHEARKSPLTLELDAKNASLSAVLTAPKQLFTPRLASKLNTLCGVDMPFQQGHHTGGYLGNHARYDGEVDPSLPLTKGVPPRPTLDQIMAWSPSFYRDLASNRLRSMHIGHEGIAWGFANPAARSGPIQRIPSSASSKDLFDSIFVSGTKEVSSNRPIVDRVLESYRQLRSGAFGDASRLSADDRTRLDDHMQRLSELERRVSVVATCGNVSSPTRLADRGHTGVAYETIDYKRTIEFYQTFNDVIVAAFICGTSRIATVLSMESWSPYTGGNWHQNVAHASLSDPKAQALITEAHRQEFESLFLDLVNKLDIEEAEGKTYLDNSLVWWCQESGFSSHDSISMPIVTAGSAAGYFKTGLAVDYRRLSGPKWNRLEHTGILYAQWLANVLMAMGVPRSEYALSPDDKGYSNGFRQPDWAGNTSELWLDRLFAIADDKLPGLTAT